LPRGQEQPEVMGWVQKGTFYVPNSEFQWWGLKIAEC
jgi:hypothetical protein